jgi:hypothetical protein
LEKAALSGGDSQSGANRFLVDAPSVAHLERKRFRHEKMKLGYYTPRFPFPQGPSAGPYPQFPGRRPRVACVMVVGPGEFRNLHAPRRKKKGCGCRHNRHMRGLRGFGQDDSSFIVMDPETAQYVDVNSGTILSPASGVQVSAGNPVDTSSLPLDASTGASLDPLQPGAVTTPESAPGSQLMYSVQWNPSLLHMAFNPTQTAESAESAFAAALTQYGMSVVSSQTLSAPLIGGVTGMSAQFLITDQVGHQYLTDAQGVCDSVMRSIVGNSLTGSNIQLASGLTGNWLTWAEQNWPWLLGGAAGVWLLWKVL